MLCQSTLILLHKVAFQPFWLLLTVVYAKNSRGLDLQEFKISSFLEMGEKVQRVTNTCFVEHSFNGSFEIFLRLHSFCEVQPSIDRFCCCFCFVVNLPNSPAKSHQIVPNLVKLNFSCSNFFRS